MLRLIVVGLASFSLGFLTYGVLESIINKEGDK